MTRLSAHRMLLLTLAAFAACSAFIVPTLTPVAIADDFIYARVVKTLVEEHRLVLGDLSAAILVGQAAWGALFAAVFGFSFGVVRVSTVVMTAVGGLGLHALARELGVPRGRAAIGTALYLFNPLVYVMAHTFMTDIHFANWLLLATWAYVRGLRRESDRWIVLGSAFTSIALLVRQQGLLIPLAVAAALVVHERRGLGRGTVRRVFLIGILPALTYATYYLTLSYGQGIPAAQGHFFRLMDGSRRNVYVDLAWRLPYIQLVIVGLTLVPLLGGMLYRPRLATVVHRGLRIRLAVLGAALAATELSLARFVQEGRLVPLGATFVTEQGLGPNDLIGGRPALIGHNSKLALTALATIAGFAVLSVIVTRFARKDLDTPGDTEPSDATRSGTPGTWVVMAILVVQLIGSYPPSFPFTETFTLDRYLLPVTTLTIPLFLALTIRVRMRERLVWALIAIIGVFSVTSTRDYLVYEHAIWNTAQSVHDSGVPLDKIDAGPAWDGWHLSDGTLLVHKSRTPEYIGWIALFAPATDSTYIVANPTNHPSVVLRTIPYSSWLQQKETVLQVRKRTSR